MPRICTNHTQYTIATDNLAVAADFFDRSLNSHRSTLSLKTALLRAEHDPSPRQIVWRQLNRYLVTGQDTDIVHTHLAGDVAKYYMTILQLDTKRRIGKVLYNLPLHLDNIFLRHDSCSGPLMPVYRYRHIKDGDISQP